MGPELQRQRNFICDDGDLSPPLLKVVVTVTTTFFKVENNKYQFFLIFWARESYFLATRSVLWPKICRKCGSGPLGELTTLPQTHSRLGSGHPSPHPNPLGAFGASMLAPSAPRSSCPPDTKSWRRHWLCALRKDFTQRKHRVKL